MSINYWTSLPIVENTVYNSLERNFSLAPLVSIKKFITRPVVYKLLPEAFIGRWDLASQEVYNTPDYFWAILAVNDIEDPFDLSMVGRNIMFPDPLDIISFINSSSFARNKQ